jgi:hypothetical protein
MKEAMGRGKKQARGRHAAEVLRQNGIPFLFRLADLDEWEAPTKVVRSIGGDPKYAVALARRLAANALIEIRPAGRVAGQPTYQVLITQRGRELIRLLNPVVVFIERT